MSEFWMKVGKTLRYHAVRGLQYARASRWELYRPLASRPLFVVGCSRAGTTLVYKTFSEAHELASVQRETHDLWSDLHPPQNKNWDTHALDAGDARDSDRSFISRYFYVHTGSLRFVDKNNQNGLCVPYLHRLFPDAHFVYVKRSPGDNIYSLIEGWGRPEEFATWSDHLPVQVAVDEGRFQRWCFFLSEGWRDYTSKSIEEVCAFQYRSMNEAILHSRRDIPPEQWTEIRYEDLLCDPVAGFRNAFTAAGLDFGDKMEMHCRTVLSHPYNAFSEIRLDKWRDGRCAERVARVLPSVADVAREMGYDV